MRHQITVLWLLLSFRMCLLKVLPILFVEVLVHFVNGFTSLGCRFAKENGSNAPQYSQQHQYIGDFNPSFTTTPLNQFWAEMLKTLQLSHHVIVGINNIGVA